MQRGRALFIKHLAYYSIHLPRSLLLVCRSLFFPLFQPLSFISFSIAIILHFLSLFPWPHSPCCLFYSQPPFVFSPLTFLLQKTSSGSFHPPLCFCLLMHCVPFVSYIDVFAIGDPNQSTILAVSIAGGIILLIFLVTCFVVSGRYGKKKETPRSSRHGQNEMNAPKDGLTHRHT